jgi:hypothetical protein
MKPYKNAIITRGMMGTSKPLYEYRICVEGHISPEWQDWFCNMTIISENQNTLLIGCLPDNPALIGVLNHLASFNLALISVERRVINPQEKQNDCSI